ncbi:MAG TPA: deoxyribose-phosphate aldolase [Candidatus Kapabacteria bacterium]|nr:deoxyribose-phosphate aldolase [Candidatus Kapabacteria bacterium]HPU24320.1 deoxyribose-phosphate aldolase [Candidatus Kapabacteria bacterium]
MLPKTKEEFAKYIDSTILRADATENEITQLCKDAIKYGFAAVCVNPCNIELCRSLLQNSKINIATVVGFPLGANISNVKFYEAGMALLAGASELDMVINIAKLKDKNFSFVEKEISEIVRLGSEAKALVKVIIETALLTDAEKIEACKIVSNSGAHFIKTSTGFAKTGATIEDIELMRKYCDPSVKIKASGGIKTVDFALKLIEAGAERIGTSSGVELITNFA